MNNEHVSVQLLTSLELVHQEPDVVGTYYNYVQSLVDTLGLSCESSSVAKINSELAQTIEVVSTKLHDGQIILVPVDNMEQSLISSDTSLVTLFSFSKLSMDKGSTLRPTIYVSEEITRISALEAQAALMNI